MSGCDPQNERIGQLYREMYKVLYVYAKNALNDHPLAEEATQDVFCIACAKSDSLLHIPDQTCQLHGEFPPGGRRKPATPPEGSASNGLCQP